MEMKKIRETLKISGAVLLAIVISLIAFTGILLANYGLTTVFGKALSTKPHCHLSEKAVNWRLSNTSYAFYEVKATGQEFIGIHEELPLGYTSNSYALKDTRISQEKCSFSWLSLGRIKNKEAKVEVLPQEFNQLLQEGRARIKASCG